MKKAFLTLACILAAATASAQRFGSSDRTSLKLETGDISFFAVIDYVHFGFVGMLPGSTQEKINYNDYSDFFRSTEFGFNIIEFGVQPTDNLSISLGADVDWNTYRLKKNFAWLPTPTKEHVMIADKTFAGATDVKRSTLTVCSFQFPLNLCLSAGRVSMMLGASAELNFKGVSRFKGTNLAGESVNERRDGLRFSRELRTNTFTYNVHAAVGYGGLGLYAKYSPRPRLAAEYGPQFSTWTVGLVLGIGI